MVLNEKELSLIVASTQGEYLPRQNAIQEPEEDWAPDRVVTHTRIQRNEPRGCNVLARDFGVRDRRQISQAQQGLASPFISFIARANFSLASVDTLPQARPPKFARAQAPSVIASDIRGIWRSGSRTRSLLSAGLNSLHIFTSTTVSPTLKNLPLAIA